MATASTPSAGAPPADVAPRRSDRSPWNWLLLIPIVVPLLVPLYNHADPKLGSWPLFYWLQLVFVALGVLTTALVYRMTRRSPAERQAARDAITRDTTAQDTAAREDTARDTTARDTTARDEEAGR